MKLLGYYRDLPTGGKGRLFSEVTGAVDDTHVALYTNEPADRADQRIVAAANRYGDVVVVSARHHDQLMNQQLVRLKEAGVLTTTHTRDQGFIDNRGQFLTREEALVVARAAGQLNTARPKTDPEYLLFSEDLY